MCVETIPLSLLTILYAFDKTEQQEEQQHEQQNIQQKVFFSL